MDYRTGLSPLRSSLWSGISSPRLPTKTLPPAPRILGNASRRRGRGRSNTGSEAGPPGAGLREPCARDRRGPGSAKGQAARGCLRGDAGPLAGLGAGWGARRLGEVSARPGPRGCRSDPASPRAAPSAQRAPACLPQLPHLCSAADLRPAAPPGEALRSAGGQAAAARRAATAPTSTQRVRPPGSSPGDEPRPSRLAPPRSGLERVPDVSPSSALKPRPVPSRPAPSESATGPARPGKSFAGSWVARASSRALSRCGGGGGGGRGARRLAGSRRGDVGLTSSAAGLLRSVAGGSGLPRSPSRRNMEFRA
ncbi:ubiquitin carboxyl-terminal hydrolase isozyme L5 isoform X3 [Pteropus medius]|uniref:ubiquitin carboxyl-terminal hydrolase isozyme L5 isoform X3 n=1 Tax=Pteropus vampyrus TaxID=132908 RepID=UPI00196B8434|nr:ubiquitin carboxyl-terminal hydrolase isozyme L5 isoform X3 [Pteropus giganteus]